MVPQLPVVMQSPVNLIYLTQSLGFLGSPDNLIDIALDNASTPGSIGGFTTVVSYAPHGPVSCFTVVPVVGNTLKQLEFVTPVLEHAHVRIQSVKPEVTLLYDHSVEFLPEVSV